MLNKKEIHSELLYRRVFEISKFEPIIEYFTEKLKYEKSKSSVYILRKMCMIDGNPLPLVQKRLLDLLYFGDYDLLAYGFETTEDGIYLINKHNSEKLHDTNSGKLFSF